MWRVAKKNLDLGLSEVRQPDVTERSRKKSRSGRGRHWVISIGSGFSYASQVVVDATDVSAPEPNRTLSGSCCESSLLRSCYGQPRPRAIEFAHLQGSRVSPFGDDSQPLRSQKPGS